ncbi:MAG: hypothetical protein EOO74_01345, partial [Myxococcales bacterium]
GLEHAHLDETLVATLPSSTIPAWVTAFSGVGPAHHGITGNEFFIRERREFAAPIPTTFEDAAPVIACYTDDYLVKLREAPSLYDRIRKQDPNAQMWVAMHQYSAGADRLITTSQTVLADAFHLFIEEQARKRIEDKESRKMFQALDEHVVDAVSSQLDRHPDKLPDVLTVYLSGTDQYAHVAEEGPDKARRSYLREVGEPLFKKLHEAMRKHNALANRYVLLTADHGHTEVKHDDPHSLAMKGETEPPRLMEKAGYRVRPFKLEVDPKDDFQSVLAYQGAIAYVYVADRTACQAKGATCDWTAPPRFQEDVVPLAEAFYRNNLDGSLVPELKGTLDMVLTRQPRPHAQEDLPFQVYVGDGKMVPVPAYLAAHPHPTYEDLDERLRDLAVGPFGERAGDILLIAHNGDRTSSDERYYFATLYHSWHGSPSRDDSDIPLIVAHPGKSSQELARLTHGAIGDRPKQQKFTDLVLTLRGLSARAPR